jgi:hypothetical protein
MQSDPTEHVDAVFNELKSHELALAIHVGGMPVRWRDKTADEIRSYARRGITLIGVTGLRLLHAEIDRLDQTLHQARQDPSIDTTAEQAEWRRLWRSRRRRQSAVDAAWSTFVYSPETHAIHRRYSANSVPLRGLHD